MTHMKFIAQVASNFFTISYIFNNNGYISEYIDRGKFEVNLGC